MVVLYYCLYFSYYTFLEQLYFFVPFLYPCFFFETCGVLLSVVLISYPPRTIVPCSYSFCTLFFYPRFMFETCGDRLRSCSGGSAERSQRGALPAKRLDGRRDKCVGASGRDVRRDALGYHIRRGGHQKRNPGEENWKFWENSGNIFVLKMCFSRRVRGGCFVASVP